MDKGGYDSTTMSAHFPPDLEELDDDASLFPFTSLDQLQNHANQDGMGFGYAGQLHALQAYQDASYVPATNESFNDSEPAQGYGSAYQQAIADSSFLPEVTEEVLSLNLPTNDLPKPTQANATPIPPRPVPTHIVRRQAPNKTNPTADRPKGTGKSPVRKKEPRSPPRGKRAMVKEFAQDDYSGGYKPENGNGQASSSFPPHSSRFPTQNRPTSANSNSLYGLHLLSSDAMQCRFAVKNDEKEGNQALEFVQRNGYVEYKARYCKKRGGHVGYGHFRIGVLPKQRCIYPLMQVDNFANSRIRSTDEEYIPVTEADITVNALSRVEITVRLYQSFRGCFPARVAKFGEEEVYHPLFVDSWQNATILQSKTGPLLDGIEVIQDPSGEFIRYVTYDEKILRRFNTEVGIKFPCPVPTHPERLNDIGMLRMQVSVQVFYHGDTTNRMEKKNTEFQSWIKLKVVQQLSGKKRKFADMLREPSKEWCLPPIPKIIKPDLANGKSLQHMFGRDIFNGGSSVNLLLQIVAQMVARDKNSVDEGGIHEACKTGNLGVLRMILQVDTGLIHKKFTTGDTPLHVAASHGHLPIVDALIAAGARLRALNLRKETAATIARQMGHVRIAQKLQALDTSELSAGCSDIFRAAAAGRVKDLQHFINNRVGLNFTNSEGQTPLMLAILNNHTLAAAVILSANADANIRDRQGNAAIHIAAKLGYADVVVLLVNEDKESLNCVGQDGRTPLHVAAYAGKALVTQVLLDYESDTTALDSGGQTPKELAILQNNPGAAYLLSDQDNDVLPQFTVPRSGTSLHEAAWLGDVALTRQLLSHGAQPNLPDALYRTPIRQASERSHLMVLDELLTWHMATMDSTDKAHNINSLGSEGHSPIHVVCSEGFIGCLLVLLSSKIVDLNLKGFNGNTPLHVCAATGRPLCAAFLLMAGAHRMFENDDRETPAQLAHRLGNVATKHVLEVPLKDMWDVSQMLQKDPQQPTTALNREEESTNATAQGNLKIFSWTGMDEVLARIWQGTHTIRKSISDTRSLPSHDSHTRPTTPGSKMK